jgi:Fe-S cluster biogenesis protein NfuA
MTSEELQINVENALEEIRPFLKSDGGDVTLISIENGKKVSIRFEGACHSCTINQMTLKSGVEMTIKKHAPQIEEVINID